MKVKVKFMAILVNLINNAAELRVIPFQFFTFPATYLLTCYLPSSFRLSVRRWALTLSAFAWSVLSVEGQCC